MSYSSDDDSDLSDSEIIDIKNKSYEDLKNGSRRVKISDQAFMCPYCPKRKRDYLYRDLLQHAAGVASCISKKRSGKDKANHLALGKYLEKDLAHFGTSSNSTVPPVIPKPLNGCSSSSVAAAAAASDNNDTVADSIADCDQDEKFVYPWIGIVVNIPTEFKDGRFVGESGSKLRDQYIRQGFNPTRVHPLWNYRGHSGSAVVEFTKDWPGLHSALLFERAYEVDHHGKKDWQAQDGKPSDLGLYAWVARDDDYKSTGIIGEHLRKIRDLKSISQIMEEEARRTKNLVANLTNELEDKSRHLKEIESKFLETDVSLKKLIEEKDKLLKSHNEEMRKIQLSNQYHCQKICNDHEKLKLQLESEKKQLAIRAQELQKREAHNEIEKKKVFEEIEKNALRNNSLELASFEQRRADENVLKLADDQKKEKERLHKKIIQLETQLDKKQALELEIERLHGELNVMKYMEVEGDVEVRRKMEGILECLRENEGDLDVLLQLNQTLIVKERKSNDELQEARKELVCGIQDLPSSSRIGVKRMGELDNRPFLKAVNRKYPGDGADDRALELCSLWEEYLRDSEWHPFKIIKINEREKEVIDDEDDRLKSLRNDLGDEVYEAVTTALLEINEYNPSGRYITTEIWNHEEGRKASLGEGVTSLIEQFRAFKQRRIC